MWVEREAHAPESLPDFIFIPIDGPPIAPVPEYTSRYHFNDKLLYAIRAAELETVVLRARK